MTHRFPAFVVLIGLLLTTVACSDNDTSTPDPTPVADPRFTSVLLSANEIPAVVGGDIGASGTMTMQMTNTKDAAGNITASRADFTVTLTGFPAGTVLTGAHIHPGAAGATGGVIWSLGIASGDITLPTGATTFTRVATAPNDIATAQALINNPAGFYFNVHTTLNTGGAVRGQMVRAN